MILLSFLLGCIHRFDPRMTAGHVAVKEIILACEDEDAQTCKIGGAAAAGTATRITWNDNYYWLTAAHVCSLSSGLGTSLARQVVITSGGSGEQTPVERITYNVSSDLCLMPAKTGPAREIARKDPALGEPVSIIAYPGGAFSSNTLPIYDGRFTGRSEGRCLSTIPVSGGSSGAGVLDEDGAVVGVVSAVMKSFNHYTITVCLSDLRDFLVIAAPQVQAAEAAAVQTAGQKKQE